MQIFLVIKKIIIQNKYIKIWTPFQNIKNNIVKPLKHDKMFLTLLFDSFIYIKCVLSKKILLHWLIFLPSSTIGTSYFEIRRKQNNLTIDNLILI